MKTIFKGMECLLQFLSGAFMLRQKSVQHIENELANEEDEFLLLCFTDLLGIDLPTKYYLLEILPYLAENMEKWEGRMSCSKSIWEDRFSQLDMDI